MATKAGGRRYWLTVTATPYALSPSTPGGSSSAWTVNLGGFAYKYPYDVQLFGARAGSPHTTLADNDVLAQLGEGWGMRNGEGGNSASIPAPQDTDGYAILEKAQAAGGSEIVSTHLANAKGKRHPNGGGWVADSATVDATAYIAPEKNPVYIIFPRRYAIPFTTGLSATYTNCELNVWATDLA